MQAIEFETYVHQKAFQIPLQFQYINNVNVKVILLYSEPKKKGNYSKELLLKAFEKARQNEIFKNVDTL